MKFEDIYKEYYALFRGQAVDGAVDINDREYVLAVQLANAAIRKWDRVDGVQWRELWTTLAVDGGGDTDISTTNEFAAPANMRKPPAYVNLIAPTATAISTKIQVIDPHDAQTYSGQAAYFVGSANTGYTMYFINFSAEMAGYSFDYPYLKKPTMITKQTSKPDMSDPTFIIQDMLASRAQQARNGFLYKTAKSEATTALTNMKIENDSGTYRNSMNIKDAGAGFGLSGRGFDRGIAL